MQINELQPILGVILAGGQARRMGGGDKGLKILGERPLIAHVIERLRPQVAGQLLNANGDPVRFAQLGLPVVADSIPDHPGPLAGILAGLDWAAIHQPASRWIVTVPGDGPFLPSDLVTRLAAGLGGSGLGDSGLSDSSQGSSASVASGAIASGRAAVARYDGRLQSVTGIWSVTLRQDLRAAILDDKLRRVEDWLKRCNAAAVDFPLQVPDPFLNVNTPEDLARAAAFLDQPDVNRPDVK
jgi:molybdopterin-guanine dinucleotide biosynthesis protein A